LSFKLVTVLAVIRTACQTFEKYYCIFTGTLQ